MSNPYQSGGTRVLECPAEMRLASGRDATDLISLAREHEADLVAVPAERVSDDFFRLATGLAGEIVQKFQTYEVRLAIVGDISRFLEKSSTLRAFVIEANRGKHVWFTKDAVELQQRMEMGSGI